MNVDEFLTPQPRLVLLARCGKCHRPARTLLCAPDAETVDQVRSTAHWAPAATFRNACECERDLPAPSDLGSHIGRAFNRGLRHAWETSAPVTIRV